MVTKFSFTTVEIPISISPHREEKSAEAAERYGNESENAAC